MTKRRRIVRWRNNYTHQVVYVKERLINDGTEWVTWRYGPDPDHMDTVTQTREWFERLHSKEYLS